MGACIGKTVTVAIGIITPREIVLIVMERDTMLMAVNATAVMEQAKSDFPNRGQNESI